jgi:hypothetical protein
MLEGDRRDRWSEPLSRQEVAERMRWMVIILLGSAAVIVGGFCLGVLIALLIG